MLLSFPLFYAYTSNNDYVKNTDNTLDVDFQNIDLSKGDQEVELKADKGTNWTFKLDVPDMDEDEKRPLVIALHWSGEEDAYEEFNSCLIEPGLEKLRAFIITPDGENVTWESKSNVEKVINLVALAKKHWPIDPEKIVVTGYSDGGNASWFFADQYPDHFTAAIPIASVYRVRNTKIIQAPIYIIHGTEDEHYPAEQTLFYAEKALNEGNNIEFYAAEGLSHFMPCEYATHLMQASRWLRRKAWK